MIRRSARHGTTAWIQVLAARAHHQPCGTAPTVVCRGPSPSVRNFFLLLC